VSDNEQAGVPPEIQDALRRLSSGDRSVHGEDFVLLQQATAQPVQWADAAWQLVMPLLRHGDNRVRSIAGQFLNALAAAGASPETVLGGLDALVSVTHDDRFVTARHVLVSLWKVGLRDGEVRRRLLAKLTQRSRSAVVEKNAALIRHDVVCCLRRLFDETGDEAVRSEAAALIADEPDTKNAQKMRAVWRDLSR
jgi:hypothetical protein